MKKRLLRKLPDVNLQLYLVERLTSYLLWLFSELHHLFPLMKLANTNQNLFFPTDCDACVLSPNTCCELSNGILQAQQIR